MTSPEPNVSCEPITLEAVKSKFHQWRTSRSKRSKVPECLWDDVRQLSKLYSYSQISSQLRISYQQLHAHLEEGGLQHNNLSSSESNFINAHLPLPQWQLSDTSRIVSLLWGAVQIAKFSVLVHPNFSSFLEGSRKSDRPYSQF